MFEVFQYLNVFIHVHKVVLFSHIVSNMYIHIHIQFCEMQDCHMWVLKFSPSVFFDNRIYFAFLANFKKMIFSAVRSV